jgi:hypothetical protein
MQRITALDAEAEPERDRLFPTVKPKEVKREVVRR